MMKNMNKQDNWLNLQVGDKIKIDKKSSKVCGLKEGEIIILIQGQFDEYNGLYDETVYAPSIWNDEQKEFDSIYHIFGNDLGDFLDSEIIK